MKKLLLLLLTVNLGFAQLRTIQIKLIDPNIGAVHYYSYDGGMMGSIGNSSNDAGLNQIFTNHGISSYYDGYGHGDGNEENYKLMDCNNCNVNQLVADLTAYQGVVQKANISPEPRTFSDIAYFKPLDQNLHQTGTANAIVLTDNSTVNQIFENRQVYYFNEFLTWRNVICDCNVDELVADLIAANIFNPNTIDAENHTIYDNYNYQQVVFLLKNREFESNAYKVYPNPFETTFTIDSNEKISHYTIYDIAGKQLAGASSKSELDTQSTNLKRGIYLLQLETETGKIATQKLIKQ